jgi:hypothetical protein
VTRDPNPLEVLVVTPVLNPLAQAQIPVLNQLDLDPAQTVDNKLKQREDSSNNMLHNMLHNNNNKKVDNNKLLHKMEVSNNNMKVANSKRGQQQASSGGQQQ